ncbi:Flp pilus assembly protein TadG [Limimaricola soesokkakensis]|uniref:Flp pilus assembly protein TadG n=1 Tax=Limimaricola soesokkakensis TaxID=1343159 RepID=A0A1X6Z517_9RHOB|nr:TadE/TadG family type IV pilus assembly protein [Limimaricola soesokkakensis]PSK86801.1 Flp pilus assembly protein TadG [Limimaricola soesokkakensis]SLN41246.1 von Willebrand factor type A domain protein [Limimaricola soesokkakensis]
MIRVLSTRQGLGRLRRDESGSVIIFSLFVMVIMLVVGGLGVDTMRVEAKRNHLQSTLDRAVLAAADLQQSLDPETVVRDHFAKAGLSDALQEVEVINTLNSRTVRASAQMPVPATFLRMAGIDTMPAPAAGSATESVSDIEIGLVLDVSGSMGSNNRLTRLKSAGAEFIDTMFASVLPENLSISIVPYSTQVNLGRDLGRQYGLLGGHDYSYCVDLPPTAYLTTAQLPVGLIQAGHFEANTNSGSYGSMRNNNPVCRTDSPFEVMAWSNDRNALQSKIANLSASGWTSIEMGVNWGAALLDPTARGVLNGMLGLGRVSGDLSGWPRDFNHPEGMKVLVVMTDGENTRDYTLRPPYNTIAPSDVWLDGTDDYYVYVAPLQYFRAKDRTWVTAPRGTRLSWAELFNRMSIGEHAHHLRYRQNYNSLVKDYWNSIYDTTWSTQKDLRTKAICAAARANGIVVFTIGFEVDAHAAGVMADCASSPSHFYRVEGLEIASAFTSIATQINALRLIQ